ncbi:MAG: cell division protein FtsL [Paracoccaceae bacterium]
MRPLLYIVTFLAVMGSAFWAYRENYATQAALKDVAALQSEIADLREGLTIQRAEWAYLNRPDRLRELASINFDRLGLLPLEPEQFGQTGQVAYPAPVVPQITGQVDVVGDQAQAQTQTPGQDQEVFP